MPAHTLAEVALRAGESAEAGDATVDMANVCRLLGNSIMTTRQTRYSPRRIAPAGMIFVTLIASPLAHEALAQGAAADTRLLADARKAFERLPDAVPQPSPESADLVRLGKMLFFDPRISTDGVGSCAHCHKPALYGTDALPGSRGVHDVVLPRNAPTVLNSSLQFKAHWDGFFKDVEDQAEHALLSPAFGHSDNAAAMKQVRRIPGYVELFTRAFPGKTDPVTAANWGRAIGAYERTLLTPSRWDKYLDGKIEALSDAERRGAQIFLDRGCADCHGGVGVGGSSFKKFGVVEDYWKLTHSHPVDKGRFNVTKNADDTYVFKVPSLRNVAMTPPYFHDGSVKSLPEAVGIMGRVQSGTDFSETETNDLIAFLNSLTGDLPEDFATAPVLPPASYADEK